jgi:hypothetical protein
LVVIGIKILQLKDILAMWFCRIWGSQHKLNINDIWGWNFNLLYSLAAEISTVGIQTAAMPAQFQAQQQLHQQQQFQYQQQMPLQQQQQQMAPQQ